MALNLYEEASQFSDWRLYIGEQARCCGLLSSSTSVNFSEVNVGSWVPFNDLTLTLQEYVQSLLDICKDKNHWESFLIEFQCPDREFLRYRVQELKGIYALKKLTGKTMDLSDLQGVTDSVLKFITNPQWKLTGGLVLMVGDASVGKSLFTAAAMRERLKLFGGYCLVLGDPPEHSLGDNGSSFVGSNGYVDYVDVSSIGYTDALMHSLRTYPMQKKGSLIFSEIRSDANASDLINSASNGHLIFATLHAKSPDAALERLISWAIRSGVTVEIIRNMIASTLLGITYHSILLSKHQTKEFPCTDEIKNKIRQGHPLPFQSAAPYQSPTK